MSQPAVSKHLKVLERAGLISREPRRAIQALPPGSRRRWKSVDDWLEDYRRLWKRGSTGWKPISPNCSVPTIGTKSLTAKTAKAGQMTGFKQIVITRSFDAPRELYSAAGWSRSICCNGSGASPDWTSPHARTDPRAGGAFDIGFGSPDGKYDFDFTGVYDVGRTALAPGLHRRRRTSVTVLFAENNGRPTSPSRSPWKKPIAREQQREGWTAMLANLGLHLERKTA